MTDHTPRAESSAIDGSPVWLWLDPTTRCNLACRLCYTKLSHGKDDMTPKDLRRMLCDLRDSASVDVQTIHLNWRGEPLSPIDPRPRDSPEIRGFRTPTRAARLAIRPGGV